MPLPEGGHWPPKNLDDVRQKMEAWSAWYSGDPDELGNVYESIGQRNIRHPHIRPSQYRGGLVGALARWFWGQPVGVGEKRTKLHVPVASDIASTSSKLLFSEPPKLTIKDSTAQDRLNKLVDDGVHAVLLEAAEVGSGLGGSYLKVCWDKDVSDRPWLGTMHADAAVPEFRYGKLSAVTFWRVLYMSGSTVVRHLERHEKGVILHGVYTGGPDELGKETPLTEYAETEAIAEAVSAGNRIETDVDSLTAVYVPNMRPNRLWRNNPAAAYLGRSDFAGTEPFMDALDETYTSWMRDVRLAKARLIVPDSYVTSRGVGRGSFFDPDQELYETLQALPGEGSMEIKAQQFAIRTAEHKETASHWLELILRGAGYSAQTFGEHGEGGAITATEVRARERKTYSTRDMKIVLWRPALMEILETLLKVDQVQFNSSVTPEKPDVEFVDATGEDPKVLAETADLLRRAEAASTRTLVKMLHSDWDDKEIDAEVDLINGESGRSVEDPGTFRGGPVEVKGPQPPSTVDKVENMPEIIPAVDQ